MIGVFLSHDSALCGYTGPRTTWANEVNFVRNHAPGVASIAEAVDKQSSALPLFYGCPIATIMFSKRTTNAYNEYSWQASTNLVFVAN